MRGPLPREKRLLIVFLLLAFLVAFTPSVLRNAQLDNLSAIRAHISQIQPRWREFQRQNAGFDDVHFFDYTGGDGMFGAWGRVPSDKHLAELQTFMQSTTPPRPVYVAAVHVLDQAAMDLLKKANDSEVEGPANGNKSIRFHKTRARSPVSSRR